MMSKSVDKRVKVQLGEQPVWVCSNCGDIYGRNKRMSTSTWHFDTCNVCCKQASVTEAKYFGYLTGDWEDHLSRHNLYRAD